MHHLVALSVLHHVIAAGTTQRLQINFGAVGMAWRPSAPVSASA